MNNLVKDEVNIENLIYEVRGVPVILDSDLAKLYKCTNGTKDINKAVKRNIERFPDTFMFRLTNEECKCLRFQIGTSNVRGGRRYNPYVFTEQGVAMLSGVIYTETAIKTSIQIINAFAAMRKYISSNLLLTKNINNLVLEDHNLIIENRKRICLIEDTLAKFEEKQK